MGFGLTVKRGILGYPYEGTLGIKAETPRIRYVAKEIRKQSNVIVCTKSIGKFNMCCLIIAKNMDEFDGVTQKIRNIPGVKSIGINIIIQSFAKFGSEYKRDDNEKASEEPDEVDKAIIKELIEDSRASFLKVGKKLKLSHQTVKNRFEKLKANGIIIGSRAIIDNSKLGYQGTVFIFISLVQGSEKTTAINELKKIPELERINAVMGLYDIITFAPFRGLRDFTKLINEIQQISSIGDIEICLANYTYFTFKPTPKTPIKCDSVELT